MCLRKTVKQLLFKGNVLKGDLSLNVEVFNEVKLDSKVLRLSVPCVINNIVYDRLYIRLESKGINGWNNKL
jgi:hypothetical protein